MARTESGAARQSATKASCGIADNGRLNGRGSATQSNRLSSCCLLDYCIHDRSPAWRQKPLICSPPCWLLCSLYLPVFCCPATIQRSCSAVQALCESPAPAVAMQTRHEVSALAALLLCGDPVNLCILHGSSAVYGSCACGKPCKAANTWANTALSCLSRLGMPENLAKIAYAQLGSAPLGVRSGCCKAAHWASCCAASQQTSLPIVSPMLHQLC